MKTKALLLFLLTFNLFWAQKSAPVAGDAATLVDLIKKDYTTGNQETLREDIYRDRAKAISILKSYLKRTYVTDAAKNKTYALNAGNLTQVLIDAIKDDELELEKLELELNSLIEKNPSQDTTERTLNNNSIASIKSSMKAIEKRLLQNQWGLQKKEFEALETEYSNNPYVIAAIKIFMNKYNAISDYKSDLYSEVDHASSIQKSIPFLGGDLAFETFIDGLSRFLAKRIKAELTNYVMENIKTKLDNPNEESLLNELMVLLPNTTDYIKQFDADEILNFTDVIKQHIETDLGDILTNAANLKTTPRFQKLIKDKPDLEFAFEALQIIPQLSKVKYPIEYFDLLENSELIQSWASDDTKPVRYNIANTLKLASMLAHSMVVIDNNEQKFASTNFITNYGSEPEFLLLYFGFLNQQELKYFKIGFHNGTDAKELNFKKFMDDGITAQQILDGNDAINALQNAITQITENAEKLYQDALKLKKASNDDDEKVAFTDIHAFVDSFANFFEQVINSTQIIAVKGDALDLFGATNTLGNKAKELKEKLLPYIKTTRSANNIALYIHDKKYSTALITALEIPSNFNASKTTENNSLNNAITILRSSAQLVRLQQLTDEYDKLPNKFEAKSSLLELLENVYKNSNSASLKTAINTIITAVEGDNSTNYKNALESLTTQLGGSALQDSLFEDITGIRKTDLIAKLTANINDTVIKTKLQNHLDSFVSKYFAKVINDSKESQEEFTVAKDNLTRTIRLYFPELITDTFKITDKNVVKIINFVNDVALAEKAEDVEKALEAFALPTGSYTVKRNAISNVSVNAYPGIFAGANFSEYNNQKGSLVIGFTAPVGISAKFWGVNLFVPIIDIAAPVRLRLDDDSNTKTLPEFTFGNIFTPGLYASVPLNNTPFAINFGAQFGPELSFEDDTNGNLTSNLSEENFSVNVAFVIDIPLFTLYNKPKAD